MRISKEIKFDAAHMLSLYDGKCSNLHGHTYTGLVEIFGEVAGDDMVLDYNIIKDKVDVFDHAVIFSPKNIRNIAEQELYEWCLKYNMRHIVVNRKCTAEHIAAWIADSIWSSYENIRGVRVVLHETVGSTAIAESGNCEE